MSQQNNQPKNQTDLTDSANDRRHLQPETTEMQLPDVNDIPGQEHITNAGVPAAMSGATASSAGEEGDSVFGENDGTASDIVMGTSADVTKEDLAMLGDKNQDMDGGADEAMRNTGLDATDNEGAPLNEDSSQNDKTGEDLVVPGSNADNAMEDIGEEDEENNYYSLGSSDNDNMVEGTP